MRDLICFLKDRWQELVVLGLGLPMITGAWFLGNVWLSLMITGVVATIVVAIFAWVARVKSTRRTVRRGDHIAFQIPRHGIIFTVGRQIETMSIAYEQQAPKIIGLICTSGSESFADALIAQYRLSPEQAQKRIVDAASLKDVRAATDLLVDWMAAQGLTKRQIVVDITGGLTTLSIGAFSMAEDLAIDSQYIRSDFDEQNHPVIGSQVGVLVARYPDVP